MKPLKIIIEKNKKSALDIPEIKYVIKTLLTIAGLPWHFVNDKDEDNIDLYYGSEPRIGARLSIQMSSFNSNNRSLHSFTEGNETYLEFGYNSSENKKIHQIDNNKIKLNNDIIFSSYYLLSGKHERGVERDAKGRHRIEDLFMYKHGLLHTPIINQYDGRSFKFKF